MNILLILTRFLMRTLTTVCKVEFAAPMQPNKSEVEAPIPNESCMSDFVSLHKMFSLCRIWKVLIQILMQRLNKLMIARLMGHQSDLCCMQIMHFGTKL